MLRTALCFLVAWVGVVDAGPPKYPRKASAAPGLAEAERRWAAATAEPDLAKASELWEAAAEAFVAASEKATAAADRKEAATGAVLAWKNAMHVDPRAKQAPGLPPAEDWAKVPSPTPIPDREQRMLRAFDRYLAIDRTSDDAIGLVFMQGNVYRRYNHYDKALPIFLDIIEKHPAHETAEYAANLTLDTYNRIQDYDKLVAFAEKLRADKAFLAKRDDLKDVVEKIHMQAARKTISNVERRASDTRDPALFDKCGEMYLELAREPGRRTDDLEELAYNAGVCFQAGGSTERALSAFSAIPDRSRLRPRTIARMGHLHARMARYREAAALLEEYAMKFAGESDAVTAASDAFLYRAAMGDLAGAERNLAFTQRTFMRKRPDVESAIWHLARLYLDAGQRADARRLLAPAPDPSHPELRLPAARVLAEAACSVAWIDEECPGSSDTPLLEKARRILRSAPPSSEQRRLSLDLDSSAAREAGYRTLLEHRDPALRMAAHARLGALALANKQRDTALRLLATCSEQAIEHAHHRWLLACDRLLAMAGAAVEGIGELRSTPHFGGMPADLEAAVAPGTAP